MTKQKHERLFTKKVVSIAIFGFMGLMAAFTLGLDAQEIIQIKEGKAIQKNKAEQKDDAEKMFPTAPGLYREFCGVIHLGNYSTLPQKKDPKRQTLNINGQSGIESMEEYFQAPDAPHVGGGTVYYTVFRNVSGGGGDTFGTGMPGGLDDKFVAGEGDVRPGVATRAGYASPRLDTSAKYLYLFQVVAGRGLDPRNQLTSVKTELIENAVKLILGEEQNKKIKFAVGEDKVKLVQQQNDAVKSLADAVNKAMMPDDAVEDVHRFSVQLNVDPSYITSWGYFEDAAFAVGLRSTKEYTDRWGHKHKTIADGGVIPNDLVEDRIQAVSFLPGVTELLTDVRYDRINRAIYDRGIIEGSFHVNEANVGIEKSLPYRFAQGMLDRGAPIRFASHLEVGKKKADFAVRPQRVRIVVNDEVPLRPSTFPDFIADDDYTTSAFVVDFDTKGIQKRTGVNEVRGIPRAKHSMVFGFTTNLDPTLNQRHRLDDLDSTDRNKELPFSEFFSDKTARKVPARSEFSRGFDYWNKNRKVAGSGFDRLNAFAKASSIPVASDAPDGFEFVLQGGAGGGGAGGGGAGGGGSGGGGLGVSGLGVTPPVPAGGGAGVGGGFASGLGAAPGGGGGGFSTPGFTGGFSRPGGGIGSGGGLGGGQGGGTGNGNGNGSGNSDQSQAGEQQGQQTINFQATLTNQQKQQQQQGQFQFQNQHQHQNQHQRGNHNHGHKHGHHGHVVPAPASLLLGLLGLPGLFLLLRRRKTNDATLERNETIA